MELHRAIKKAISDFGEKVIVDDHFINILSDFQAFEEFNEAKHILEIAKKENILKRIHRKSKKSFFSILFGSHQNDIEEYIDEKHIFKSYFRRRGEDTILPMYVIDCILYGLGIIPKVEYKSEPIQKNNTKKMCPSIVKSNKASLTGNTQFVVLRVNPVDSVLLVDGHPANTTNGIFAEEMTEGQYLIEASHSSGLYNKLSFKIQVKAQIKIDQVVNLSLKNPPIPITIKVNDRLTELYIDGTKASGSLWKGNLATGKHLIVLKKEGYRDLCHELIINEKDKNRTIEYTSPTNPICGSVRITSKEIGVPISMDKKYVGDTPIILHNVLIGKHIITLSYPDKSSACIDFSLNEGETVDIDDSIILSKKTNSSPKQNESLILTKIICDDPNTDLYVDDDFVGKNKWRGYLSRGVHYIEQRLPEKKLKRIDTYIILPNTALVKLKKLRETDKYEK